MDRIFASLFKKRETPIGASAVTPIGGSTGKKTVGGASFHERIIHAASPQLALTVSAVYRATELRAKTMGVMPVQYQKRDSEGGNFITDMRGVGKRINYLLQEEPNPITTAASLWEQVNIDRIMRGNGFVYIERDEYGFPSALWLIRIGSYDIITGTYNISYLSDYGYVEKVNVPREDVLHFPNTFRLQNGFWGISIIQYAAETLSIIKTQKNQALETAAKGGRMKLIIGEGGNNGQVAPISNGFFDKKEMEDYADEINDRIYQKDVIALRALSTVQNISLSASEMQLLEQMNLGLDDVARFWAVPRPLLMLDTNSHYNDYQNATMEFHTRTILPDKTEMEKEIFRKLIGKREYGYRRIHVCEKPLLAMDPERQAKVDLLNLQTGANTVNEIRAGHDMPSVEGGDRVFRTANVKGLDEDGAPTELQPGNYIVSQPKQESNEEGK